MTDLPGAFNLPYEEIPGDSIPFTPDDPIIVDNFTFRGGLAEHPHRSTPLGVAVFTFWSSTTPDVRYELTYLSNAEGMRQLGDVVRNGARHVANRIERSSP